MLEAKSTTIGPAASAQYGRVKQQAVTSRRDEGDLEVRLDSRPPLKGNTEHTWTGMHVEKSTDNLRFEIDEFRCPSPPPTVTETSLDIYAGLGERREAGKSPAAMLGDTVGNQRRPGAKGRSAEDISISAAHIIKPTIQDVYNIKATNETIKVAVT